MANGNSDEMILSRDEVRACDAAAMERFGVTGLVLMENAGGGAARVILDRLKDHPLPRVCICAGPGNNGGDGFVVARHLYNADIPCTILRCCAREKYRGDARANLEILEKMGVDLQELSDDGPQAVAQQVQHVVGSADLVVDALLGTGMTGAPREPIRTVIETINALPAPTIALDIPSGLDCDTAEVADIAVKAEHTITFAAMKRGFLLPRAAGYTGSVTVVEIGIDTKLLM